MVEKHDKSEETEVIDIRNPELIGIGEISMKITKMAEISELDSPKIVTSAKVNVDAIVAEVVGEQDDDSCDEDEDDLDGVEISSDDYSDVIDTSANAAKRNQ